jgi:hypothetical protein
MVVGQSNRARGVVRFCDLDVDLIDRRKQEFVENRAGVKCRPSARAHRGWRGRASRAGAGKRDDRGCGGGRSAFREGPTRSRWQTRIGGVSTQGVAEPRRRRAVRSPRGCFAALRPLRGDCAPSAWRNASMPAAGPARSGQGSRTLANALVCALASDQRSGRGLDGEHGDGSANRWRLALVDRAPSFPRT